MKICFVADNINPQAGLGRMVQSITSGLVEKGHEVGFVVSSGESKHPVLQAKFRYSLVSLFSLIKDVLRIRKFVKNYDAVVCFDVQPAGILVHLATLGRSDVVVVHSLATYSLFTKAKKIKNKLIARVYKYSDRVFIINEFVKRKIEESNKRFSFGKNVRFVPVGVDSELFNQVEPASFKYGRDYIVSVGAIKPRKGQLHLIEAFNKIKNKYPELNYVIIGSTTDAKRYFSEINNYIKENQLDKRIAFVQGVSDEELIDLYSGATLFVLTPISTDDFIEGFGMVYIEAALCGLTSIGTSDSGAEAAIVDGRTGLLVPQGDVEAMAEKISLLLDNESLRRELAENAHSHALTYDWQYVVNLYESELTEVIN